MSEWLDAGPDFDAGRRVVTLGNRAFLLVRDGGTLHAVDALCPHKFAMLDDGEFADGCVACPQHEATFSLTTGLASEAWAGRLPVHEARVDAGRILVRLAIPS